MFLLIEGAKITTRVQQCMDSQSTWWYTEKMMATMYKRICRITSRVKGDHVYQSHRRIKRRTS